MKYVALIYTDHAREERMTPEEREADVAKYMAFSQEGRAAGKVVAGNELATVSSATCVSVRGGDLVVTDGPYAETREQLGGYYVLECDDIDEAVRLAAKIPGAVHGAIEVRPVYEEQG